MTTTFLTAQEVAELTGIRTGKAGKSREQLQIAALVKMKIPHYVNAASRPVVVRAVISGGQAEPEPVATWQPRLAA
ncbi:MAG: hypothetical protein RL375_3697 [Pseudomonadota bacterium]|jgi:hypothetical protein